MGLKVLEPLEFSDCLADSPWFRQNLHEHEQTLDESYKQIKNIETQCRELIVQTRKLSVAQKSFAKALAEFRFDTVGQNQTDDERTLSNCLGEFGRLIRQVEEHRSKIIDEADSAYLEPLRRFRQEVIGRTLNEEKRKYEKESAKYNASLEKHLHLSTVRRSDFREADAQLDMQQHTFRRASLQYVAEIQSVQERMKFEFVETISNFFYSWLGFYHAGYIIHEDFKPMLLELTGRIAKARESFRATQAEAECLKERMLKTTGLTASLSGASSSSDEAQQPQPPRPAVAPTIKQGYVYVMEKSKIPKTITRDVLKGATWTKYYCVYQKEPRLFTMIPAGGASAKSFTDMKSASNASFSFKLKECVRCASDSIDRRFCFNVIGDDRDPLTLQALSEEDRRQWMDAMDGRQPIYAAAGPTSSAFEAALDETGFEFVEQCIGAIEERGMREQGLYRNCGVTSKVQRLIAVGLDRRRNPNERLSLVDDNEWEVKTVSSAVKTFLRNLPEPLMTFDWHHAFIAAAKCDDPRERLNQIHYYVHKLPESHRRMLQLVVRHLARVADLSSENLMTVGNLGVCFGPTMLRPKEETMAAIHDIKFCNVVVEVLIANADRIFDTAPPAQLSSVNQVPTTPTNRPKSEQRPALGPKPTFAPPPPFQTPPQKGRAAPPVPEQHYDTPYNLTANAANEEDRNHGSFFTPPQQITHVGASPKVGSTRPPPPPPPPPSSHKPSLAGHSNNSAPTITDSSDSLSSVHSGGGNHIDRAVVGRQTSASERDVSTAASASGIGSATVTATLPRRNAKQTSSDGSGIVTTASGGSRSSAAFASTSSAVGLAATHLQSTSAENCGQHDHCLTRVPAPGALVSGARAASIAATAAAPNTFVKPPPSRRVRTIYQCTPDHESELSFEAGEIITDVDESREAGWLVGTLNGRRGLIPANYVEALP